MFILAKTKVKRYLCRKLIAGLFTTAKVEATQMPIADEWINKKFGIHNGILFEALTRKQISDTHCNMDKAGCTAMYILKLLS